MRELALVVALAALVIQPPSARSLWVLQLPDRIVEYDTATFAARRTVAVPPRVFDHPEDLSVNRLGQLLFAGDRVWAWDGVTAREWARDGDPETPRQWFLSAAGDGLFAWETRQSIVRGRDGAEQSVRVATRLLRTDWSGGDAQAVVTLADLPSCECVTGACSETCPVWTAWAPNGILGDLLLATRFIEGQLQPDYQQSVIYQRQGQAWTPRELPAPVEAALDASADGRWLVEAVDDAGCCGWINESSNQLAVIQQGKRAVLYDEWGRFDNRNYDASFAIAGARLDPPSMSLAYTVAADAPKAGEEIRLSSDGKPNVAELARIRKAVAEHPTVEIINLVGAARPGATISGAALIGWLDAEQILVAQGGRLVIYDRRGQKRRDTAIQARSAADAYVR